MEVKRRVPKYRLHKHSGRGFIELAGRRRYLGQYDDPATKAKYDRIIREWKANGYQLPSDAPDDITVLELCGRFLRHPEGPTDSDRHNYILAIRVLTEMYGETPAVEFGPMALRAVRQRMVESGCHSTEGHRRGRPPKQVSRKYVNKQVNRIRRILSWAVSLELIPESVVQRLRTVKGLKVGQSDARETSKVQPIELDAIAAIEQHVSRQVWAIVQLQLLTGARPSELLSLTPADIDRNCDPWEYRPAHHKTAHRDHDRLILFGPEAQRVLSEFLIGRDDDAYLFNPREAESERREKARENRKTPAGQGNVHNERRLERALSKLRPHYTRDTYRRAVTRGCDAAFPHPELHPQEGESEREHKARLTSNERNELRRWQQAHRWNPYRLRHTAATRIRDEFGLDVAQAVLGHRSASITQVYAKVNRDKAAKAIAKVG